jgi:hypothetical protein
MLSSCTCGRLNRRGFWFPCAARAVSVGLGAGLDDVGIDVTRSMTAATRRASVTICPHSLNGRFEASPMEDFFSRSVRTWNSSSPPWASSWT